MNRISRLALIVSASTITSLCSGVGVIQPIAYMHTKAMLRLEDPEIARRVAEEIVAENSVYDKITGYGRRKAASNYLRGIKEIGK